jgi:hypothetical protein
MAEVIPFGIVGIAWFGLVLIILIGWVLYVVRQRRWSVGNRIVAAALGVVVVFTVAGFLGYWFLFSLGVSPESTNQSPIPTFEPIRPLDQTSADTQERWRPTV